MFNLKRTSTKLFLSALGAIYLSAFSGLEINILVKPYAAIVPAQLLALIYAGYLIYSQKYSKGQYPPN